MTAVWVEFKELCKVSGLRVKWVDTEKGIRGCADDAARVEYLRDGLGMVVARAEKGKKATKAHAMKWVTTVLDRARANVANRKPVTIDLDE